MKRKFIIYVVDVDGDGSEFKFKVNLNGEEVEESNSEYCFEDLMSEYRDFSYEIFEKYKIDCRVDEVEIKLDYKY